MRRLVVAALVFGAHLAPAARSLQDRPLQADGVVRLLADLEAALASGRLDALRAMAAPALPPDTEQIFLRAARGDRPTSANVRESSRRPLEFGDGYEVLADLLVRHGRSGRVMTWQLQAVPRAGARDRYQLAAIIEVAAVDGLVRMTLDTTRQFAVHNLTFRAPDLTLTMASGSAFVAEATSGVTAIVLRGQGDVHFAPRDPAEQGQLRLFARRPAFTSRVSAAFIRLNPGEFHDRVPAGALAPVKVDTMEIRRAQQIFDDFSPRTYNLDLRSLTPEAWSLEPSPASTVIELETRSHGWLTYARSPGEQEDVSFFDRARGRNVSVYASAEKLAQRGPDYSEDDDAPYDVREYRLDLTFDPARLWVSGRGTLHLRVRAATRSSLALKLAPSLAVAAVSSPTFGPMLALRVIGQSNVLVSLPRVVDRGEELTLNVTYSGRLDPQALDREALGVAGRLQVQQEARPADPFIVPPEPRFMYSNRVAWYPQAPVTDYAPATLRLTVPSEYQIVATGTLQKSSVGDADGGGRGVRQSLRTVEYVADRPVRYLACVISRFAPVARARIDVAGLAPPWSGAAAEGTGPAVNLEIVSTPRMAGRNRGTAAVVGAMLRFYARTLGEAPYPDFTLAALDDNLPGGHSPPFFAILHQPLPTTPYSWTSDPVAFTGRYPHFFLAHEIAHQWWGHAVGWKNYHEQWLSEGLAQYFAALYAGEDRGQPMLRSLVTAMRQSVRPLGDQGPIALGYRLGHIQADGRIFRAIVYNKSAVVLHMLRQFIGDEAFFAGLRRFYLARRFDKAGTADLVAAFEAHTPIPLGRYFNRWIRGSAIPRVRVGWRLAADGRSATVRVEQLGDVFDLPLVLTVQYADGTPDADVVVNVSQAAVEHRILLDRPVRRIDARDDLTLVEIVR